MIAVLVALLLLSVILRYPLVSHERYQTDSYFIHYLARSIVEDGYAEWTVSPLSLFGYYPLSYPSGVPFLTAELSIATGTSVEVSILLSNWIFAALFCLVAFCVARMFLRGNLAVALAVSFAVLAPRFVDTTYWDGSARGPAVVLITLIVLLALKYASDRRYTYLALLIPMVISVLVMHHMAVLLILYGLAYVLAVVGTSYLRIFDDDRSRRIGIAAISFAAIVSIAVIVNEVQLLGKLITRSYGEDGIVDPSLGALSIILNMGVSYTHQIGLILPVAITGYLVYLSRRNSSPRLHYPFALVIAFIPVLGSGLYISMLLAPFVAVMGAFVLSRMLSNHVKKRHRSLIGKLVILMIAGSLTLSCLSVKRWNSAQLMSGDVVEVDDQIFSDAIYMMNNYGGGQAMFNQMVLESEFLAIGNITAMSSGITSLINGDVTAEMMEGNVTHLGISFPGNLYILYYYENDYIIDRYVTGVMVHGVSYVGDVQSYPYLPIMDYSASHSRFMVIVDNSWPQQYVTHSDITSSEFLREISNATSPLPDSYVSFQSYELYRSEGITQYVVAFDY